MKKEIGIFLGLLQELQEIDGEFPLQYAVCFAHIALDEGISLTALSHRTGMPLSTVSRIIGALSEHRARGVPYGLIEAVISRNERRRKELYLTKRGRMLTGRLQNVLKTAPAKMSQDDCADARSVVI